MIVALFLAATMALAVPAVAAPSAVRSVDLGAGKVYERSDASAQLTGIDIVVSAGTSRQGNGQSGLAALAAQTVMLGQVDGVPLSERIAADGGSLDVTVGPAITRFSIEALPTALPAIASDLARVIAGPDTSAATIDAARDQLAGQIRDGERNPTEVGLEMVRGSYYVGAAGAPLLGTRESMAALTASDVAAFLAAHYVRGNVFATATGVVNDATDAGVRAVLAAFPSGSEAPPALAVRSLPAEPKRIVAQRDVGVPFVLLGFAAPSLGAPDFGAMLVLRALLDDIADRSDVNTAAPIERGLDTIYSYDIKPSTFAIAINGALLDPTTGLTIVQAILKNALAKPFAADVIRRYKDTARGQWALEALSLNDRAWQIGSAVSQGVDPATTENVIGQIDRVTPADVQRSARTYLQRYIVAIVLPRTTR